MKFIWQYRVFAVLFALLTVVAAVAQTAREDQQRATPPPAQVFPQFRDPAQEDIFGVRLHMSAKEAMSALQERFHGTWVPQCITQTHRALSLERAALCAIEKESQLTSGNRFISHIEVNMKGVRLQIELLESFPYDSEKPEQVESISYIPSRMSTSDDFQTFFAQMRKKYGPPMWREADIALWCNYGRIYGSRYECDRNAARLDISITNGLKLRDPALELKQRDKLHFDRP